MSGPLVGFRAVTATPAHAPSLVLTGERTLPGIPDENYWFQRHVVAYRLAAAAAGGRVVLDAGCGEGYGLAMLADGGRGARDRGRPRGGGRRPRPADLRPPERTDRGRTPAS